MRLMSEEPRVAPPSRLEAIFDWWFRNRQTGGITIAQFPNLALGIFITAALLGVVVDDGTAGTVLRWVAFVALAGWALDEIVRGVNPWRRFLGAAVLGWQLWSLLPR